MDYNEFLELFEAGVANKDIRIDFSKGIDNYDSPCVMCELSVGETTQSSVVFGFSFPDVD